jgi:hypothetical protein
MPRGNGTGPDGMGPMTGRGAGYCNSFAAPGCAGPAGFGRGLGCGFGNHRMYRAAGMPDRTRVSMAAVDEKTYLSNQAEYLENQLQLVKNRLTSLKEDSE